MWLHHTPHVNKTNETESWDIAHHVDMQHEFSSQKAYLQILTLYWLYDLGKGIKCVLFSVSSSINCKLLQKVLGL
jgi:hypothetical protein